jgi:uncharacterized protein (TIGR03067 family)
MRMYGLRVLWAAALIVAAGAGLAADDAKEAAVRKELPKFEGAWRVTSLEVDGTKLPEDQVKQMAARLVIHGDQFTFHEGANPTKGTFKVDPTTKPKQIDITFSDGPQKGQTIKGIYELEGDTYTVCIDIAGKGRPTALAAKAGSGHGLEVLKREKAPPKKAVKPD